MQPKVSSPPVYTAADYSRSVTSWGGGGGGGGGGVTSLIHTVTVLACANLWS